MEIDSSFRITYHSTRQVMPLSPLGPRWKQVAIGASGRERAHRCTDPLPG